MTPDLAAEYRDVLRELDAMARMLDLVAQIADHHGLDVPVLRKTRRCHADLVQTARLGLWLRSTPTRQH
jgi:hypothetical protein